MDMKKFIVMIRLCCTRLSCNSITENLEDTLLGYNVLESCRTGEYINVNKRDNDYNTLVPELCHQ